jgi:uncharacterized membrane protein
MCKITYIKRLIFLLVLTFLIKNSIGQILTFDEVQNLRTNSLNDIQNYLTNKNWEMVGSKKAKNGQVDKVGFGYLQNNEAAFILFYICDLVSCHSLIDG